jgi:hypothetical protein
MWKDGIVYLMSSKFVWGKCEIKYSQMCRLGKHPGLVQEEEFCSGMMPSLKLEIVTMRVTKVIQVMMLQYTYPPYIHFLSAMTLLTIVLHHDHLLPLLDDQICGMSGFFYHCLS